MPFGAFKLNTLSAAETLPAFTPVQISPGVGWSQLADWVDSSTGYTYSGWYTVYVTSSGFFDVIAGGNIEYILVGAGGAGGGCSSSSTAYTVTGGGGGGRVIRNTVNLAPGNYTYTIGTGGIGATTGFKPGINSTLVLPSGTVTAQGGAGGAYWSSTGGLVGQGTSSYASAGGSKPASTATTTTAGATGYNGGNNSGSANGSATTSLRSSGGGGGAGGVGGNGGNNGVGGAGGLGLHITDFFPDVTLYLAGGGGGSGGNTMGSGAAQTPGAGDGTRGAVTAGNNANSGMSYPFFYAGSGGGGVCRTTTGTYTGGNGSAGALLIKYRIA